MKVILYDNYGSPDVLRVGDIEKPIPGDNEVLVKNRAVSINSWDWDTLTGSPFEYRLSSGLLKPKSNKIHGCDIAGTVERIGKNVTHFQVGDDVFGDLSEAGWGAFAEYTCVFEKRLSIKPSRMTFEEASCLPHGGNLAVQGLVDYGKIRSGQKVLINGGGGSTGTLAIQIAKTFDVDVTAVDHAAKSEMMLSIGADRVIDYKTTDFTKNGSAYDLIFDVKTNRSVFDYKRALSMNGTYVTVGGKTTCILPIVLFGKRFKNRKVHMVVYKANKDLDYLTALFEAGKLKPVIDRCFPLEKTADAFQYFGEGHFRGKIVVTIE